VRIGTRGSALALAQARLVAEQLESYLAASFAAPSPRVELVTIATAGDRDSAAAEAGSERRAADGGPAGGGDKSRWVLELERALTEGAIDLAVHSAKDVPGELAEGLTLLGAPARASAEDVLCMAARPVASENPGAPQTGLEGLPSGARVGTSSLRRAAQLSAAREDLEVVAVRGNVDTRLRKLGAGDFDALVLARAGLQRLGREAEIAAVLDPTRFVPSPGQGTLVLEGRAEDEATRATVQAITDTKTFACLQAERAVAHALGASCNTPLGAHAVDYGCGCLHLRAWVGLPDGSAWVGDELLGGFYDPEALGRRVAERLLSAGAGELLTEAGRHAPFGAGRFGDASGASVPLIGPLFGHRGGARG
jgi:hydroxymethylbilane synthase